MTMFTFLLGLVIGVLLGRLSRRPRLPTAWRWVTRTSPISIRFVLLDELDRERATVTRAGSSRWYSTITDGSAETPAEMMHATIAALDKAGWPELEEKP